MKTAKLKNGLICVSVPNKWERFYIDTVKSIGYFENNILGFFDPNILMLPHIQILGTITAYECSFDCSEIISTWNSVSAFKSMIEVETEFLFENPLGEKAPKAVCLIGGMELMVADSLASRVSKERHDKWQQAQSRVIEKLLILKTI